MNELIELKSDEAVTTSLKVAEDFRKRHADVIKSIDKLLVSNERKNSLVNMFKKSSYKDAKGEMRPMYYMNRDGFSLLVMGFTGKEALEWKLKYIDAFNEMEKLLLEKHTSDWLEERRHGKLTRKAETDIIQQLVDYAKGQGSEHSEKLYLVYTKLANVMAGVSNRDLAPCHKLSELTFIENIILNQIAIGMESGQNYKDIYQCCKKQIEIFKDAAYLNSRGHEYAKNILKQRAAR